MLRPGKVRRSGAEQRRVKRPVVRVLTVVVLTALAVVFNAGDILLPWHPFSTYGFSADTAGKVTEVDSAAVKSGLRAGDRIEVGALKNWDRLAVGYFSGVAEGRVIRLPLSSGR